MPVYDYACSNCNHTMDKFQKTSDPDPTECPECGQHRLQRQMSATAFALKGTGWYATDFKGDKKSKSAESSKTDDKGGKEDKKTEATKDSTGSTAKDSKAGSSKDTGSTNKKAAKNDKD